jgi:hypothetical protein
MDDFITFLMGMPMKNPLDNVGCAPGPSTLLSMWLWVAATGISIQLPSEYHAHKIIIAHLFKSFFNCACDMIHVAVGVDHPKALKMRDHFKPCQITTVNHEFRCAAFLRQSQGNQQI